MYNPCSVRNVAQVGSAYLHKRCCRCGSVVRCCCVRGERKGDFTHNRPDSRSYLQLVRILLGATGCRVMRLSGISRTGELTTAIRTWLRTAGGLAFTLIGFALIGFASVRCGFLVVNHEASHEIIVVTCRIQIPLLQLLAKLRICHVCVLVTHCETPFCGLHRKQKKGPAIP